MKTIKMFTMAACLFSMAACNQNEGPQIPDLTAGKPTEVTLSISNPATRALDGNNENGVGDENKISQVDFYVFDSTGAIDPLVGDGTGLISFTGNETSKKVIVSAGENKKIVAVVNSELGPLAAGDTYATLIAKLSKHAFSIDTHNSRAIPADGFEMSGETTATVVEGTIDTKVTIAISRLVSKINQPTFKKNLLTEEVSGVNLTDEDIKKLWGEETEISNADLSFAPLGYVVVNGIDISGAFFTGNDTRDDLSPADVVWDDWTATGKTYLNSLFEDNGNYKNNYSGYVGDDNSNSDWFLNVAATSVPVYVHENKPKETTDTSGQEGFDPLSVYAFIIKGELKVEGEVTLTKTRFWRVDLVRDDNYHIMRNASYHVNIKNVTSIGHETPEEAETDPEIIPDIKSSAMEIDLIVNPWRVNIYEEEM